MEMKANTREIVISRNCGLDQIQDTDVVISYIKEKYQKKVFFYANLKDEETIFDSVTGLKINNDEYVRKIDYANIYLWHDVDVISLKDYGPLVKRNSNYMVEMLIVKIQCSSRLQRIYIGVFRN